MKMYSCKSYVTCSYIVWLKVIITENQKIFIQQDAELPVPNSANLKEIQGHGGKICVRVFFLPYAYHHSR